MVLAMLMTSFAIPVGGLIYSWIKSLTVLNTDKIAIPVRDFGPDSDPIRILQVGEQIEGAPYDWAKEID